MTEQIETDFWAAERARDTAARGRQADPSACGTCRNRVAAGGQVEHDECAQRATLLPAPDFPGWELITGMPEDYVRALPARFHTPVFLDTCTPKAWVCAVCWGDGWNTAWPCKTAVENGTDVFTPEHDAETAAKRQTAELEKAHARIAELEADLKRYVGHEPTIADEMAYLGRCLDAVHDLCDLAKQRDRATVTVAELELSLNCEWQSPTPRPALPWAHAMEASDLHLFLDDLASAALNRWRTDVDGPVPDRETLAAIEKACTDWRTPGQGLRSDEPGTGERQ